MDSNKHTSQKKYGIITKPSINIIASPGLAGPRGPQGPVGFAGPGGVITGHIIPNIKDTLNLGSLEYRFNKIYAKEYSCWISIYIF